MAELPKGDLLPENRREDDAGAIFTLQSKGKWWHAGYHLTTAIVGPTILTLPYAFKGLGWGLGFFCLTVMAAVTFYSYYLMAKVLDHCEKAGRRHIRFRELAADVLGKLELLAGESQGGCDMERRFSIKAKALCFMAKEGSIEFQLEERRKGFVGIIRVGSQSVVWLVAKVEEVVQAQAKDSSAKGFREDENCLLVREGCNKAGRFLEVAVEVDGGQKGTIWLPEGRKGWGWCHFVSEMRRMLDFQGGQIGPTIDEYPSLSRKRVEVEESASTGSRFGRSFLNVLRSTAGGLKRVWSCLLDVFPVLECFEAKLGGVEHRSAVNCYAMEAEQISSKELVLPSSAFVSLATANSLELVLPSSAFVSLAAANSLKTNEWVKPQLGFFGLIRLSAGLELKPKGVQNKAERLGHAGPVLGVILGLVPDPDPGSDPIPYPGSYPTLEPGLDPISDMGFSCYSSSDPSNPLPAMSFPGLSVMPHMELGATTAMLGEEASDFTSESPAHTGTKSDHAGDTHFKSESHFGLTKSQKMAAGVFAKSGSG